ncbi:hypothetical protein CsSME_00022991 [Camellia sinensis var. sinensis]
MAEIAILAAIAVLKQAILVLGNLVVQEGCRMSKLKEDMEWIENEMSYIQAYLEDVDDANGEQSESRVEATLLTNIRVLAFDVEDFVETYFPRIGSLHERTGCLGSCLKSATCVLCHGFAIHNLVVEIEAIRRRVENIARVRNAYGTNNSTNNSGRNIWEKRRHFLHHDEPIVVGFDEHIKTLMARVINPDLKRHVVSIVGMPGLDKTTLAKKVFDSVVNDDDYNFHHRFQCSAKVFASQRPNVKHLLQDIAKQVGLAKEKWEENVEANLSAYLKGKRYVILIDDIWDTQTWDDLENGIPKNCKNGSRIIITSRNREVGLSICGVSFLYEVQPLKPNESWNLFSMMVLDPLEITTDTIEFQELEPLGRKIVERCGFVPLAIVVVAGLLLRKEKTEHAWKGVLDNMGQDDDMCSKILALSYKDLPIHLKPCFLYFGLFPEDYEIFAFELINLWVAEGFVQEKGQRTPEDVGEDYLDHLVARNMVQVARRRYDGRIRTCRIHDLLHSLCIRVATECNFFNPHNDVTAINSAQKVRRVTNYRNSVREYISSNFQTPKLRTMLSFLGKDWSSPSRKQVKEFFKGSRFLRVLSVDGHGFSFPLPNEIGNLRRLNYFGFKNHFVKFPSSVGKLKNLMTLDVRSYRIHIPSVIWRMKQLRHILLYEESNLQPRGCLHMVSKCSFHKNGVSLPNLQTLYVVPRQVLKAKWLPNFPNLRKLGISYVTEPIIEVLSNEAPVSTKLENLRLWNILGDSEVNLTKLNLSRYEFLRKLHLQIYMKRLPEHGKLPPNLIKLTLVCTFLDEDPLVTLKELPKLKILKLGFKSYKGRKMVCSGGSNKFPQLEVLEIVMLSLNELVVEVDAMPRLNKLRYDFIRVLTIPKRILNITIARRKGNF